MQLINNHYLWEAITVSSQAKTLTFSKVVCYKYNWDNALIRKINLIWCYSHLIYSFINQHSRVKVPVTADVVEQW